MPPKIQKSKAAKLLAASAGSKGKGKKKKWSKGKVREKKMHRVVFDKATLDKLMADVPKKMKVITVYTLSEQFKISGALARQAMRMLREAKAVNVLETSARCPLYTRKAAAAK